MSKLVLCTLRFTNDQLNKLRAVSPALEVVQHTIHDRDELLEYSRLDEVEILYYGWLKPPAPSDIPSVKWVQLHTAGANQWLDSPILQRDVVITTASGIHSTPIAEYVFAQILAWRRRIPLMLRYQQRGEWASERWDKFAVPEVRGNTLGVVGYGSIGREVARLGIAFGMNILAVRQSPESEPASPRWSSVPDWDDSVVNVTEKGSLHDLLARSDFVVIALPLTDETHYIIDAAALRTMKQDAYLINIARGPIVDEQALVRALKESWIAGAGLDVFEAEPLPADSPLWDLDNVILSPHVSGFTPQYDERATDLLAENLRRYLAGEPLLNSFDPERGY